MKNIDFKGLLLTGAVVMVALVAYDKAVKPAMSKAEGVEA